MKRSILWIVGLTVAASCGLREIGGETGSEDIWTGPGAGIVTDGSGPMQKTVWYVTGFDYPAGYDWRSDQESGTVKCSLVVYANAVPMMKLPVGNEYEVSADPDMHRMIGNDLYTDYSTDSLTVIRKNGKRLFCYQGREMIVAMHTEGGDVYTLGQNRSGKGFAYRKNGEVIYRHSSGSLFTSSDVLPSTSSDGQALAPSGGLAFAFSEPVQMASGALERYYIYMNGCVSQIAVREDVKKVWDVRVSAGSVSYIASLVGISTPVLVYDDNMVSLDMPNSTVMKSCRFVPDQDDMVIEGAFAVSSGLLTSGLWRNGVRECIFPTGMTANSLCSWDDGVCCVLTHCRTGEMKIFRSGEIFAVPDGYRIMGTRPLSVIDGILYVGLTPVGGGQPVVWKDGEIEPLKLSNGYISSITSYQASQDTVRD